MAIACGDCGTEQMIPDLAPSTEALCHRCGRLLDQTPSAGFTLGLAWTVAIVVLLIPANILPLLYVSLGSTTRPGYIASGVTTLWAQGWPFLALLYGAYAVILPFVWSGLVVTVLAAVHLGHKGAWMGRSYRWALAVRVWAMPDVLIIAGLVIYIRTRVQLSSEVGAGGWCLIAAGVLSMVAPLAVSKHHVWRAIMPDAPEPEGPSVGCHSCGMILRASMEGSRCPRCRQRLHARKPNAMHRTAALLIAGYVLYFPSYYYPMSYTVQPGGVKSHTIIEGMSELAKAGYWELAAIIFMASVAIPFLKLVGLSWLVMSVHFPTPRLLVLRTRLHRLIVRIGRWSNTDPFIVALMAPMMSFPGIADVHAGKAAMPFALVVAATMLASRCFDSRLMWDAVKERQSSGFAIPKAEVGNGRRGGPNPNLEAGT